MSGGEDKKHAPSQKRLKEARAEGRIARTQDLGGWVSIAAVAMVLPLVIGNGRDAMVRALKHVTSITADPVPERALSVFGQTMREGFLAVAPLAAITVVIAIAASAAQGGIHFARKAAKPQLKRLNPGPGIKRLFGKQTLWEAAKQAAKTGVLAVVLWKTVEGLLPALVGAGTLPLGAVIDLARQGTADLVRTAVIAGLVVAIADYAVVRRRTMKQLRMTDQELKEENKQAEGDPQLKGAIRSRQMAMSRNRMMAEVNKADVVLVNPTHVAVALRYEPERGAPRVVAKGRGALAARIRRRAAENNVPMVADVPLARTVYALCDLNQPIPPELYNAIATVLAFVMRMRQRGISGGLHTVH